jgi:hypothetical protein
MKDSRLNISMLFSMTRSLGVILMASCLALGIPATDKIKPEEVVSKHLEAIGTAEARSSVTSRIIIGTSKFEYRTNRNGRTEGNAVIASEGSKSLIGMTFPEADYPYERLGFDGRSFTTGYIRPGIRSILGDFLYSHNEVFKEGLIGGVLTQAWPLLDLSGKAPKLDYEGTQKVNGSDAYVLSYGLRKGSDFRIKLFFDSKTFQHVRSEYTQIISGQMGTNDKNSVLQRSTRYRIVEEFSDFRKESGLTLPHTYKLQLLIDNQAGPGQYNWTLNLAQYAFNRKIPAESFNVEAYKSGS